jgi:hypothetical protein
MNTNTLVLLGVGAAALYFFTRPRPVIASGPLPTPGQNLGNAAGYVSQPNGPTDPSDPNTWIPGVVQSGVGILNGLLGSALKSAGSTSSSGTQSGGSTYNGSGDPYPSDYTNSSDINDGSDFTDPFAG